MSVTVRAALTGKVAPLGRRGVASGIDKRPVEGAIAITSVGLSGDAQGEIKQLEQKQAEGQADRHSF